MTESATRQSNLRVLRKLLFVAVAMFGFGYALVPLYDVLCEVTGLNGKTSNTAVEQAQAREVDTTRWVNVEFTGSVMTGLPWEFQPMQKKIKVRPGQTLTAKYLARNVASEAITGQAVPSVAPSRAAKHFKKVECFCFTQQKLEAGESKEMAVQFVVNSRLPEEVDTITLSYAFFNADKQSAKRHGGNAATEHSHHAHQHGAGANNG